MADWIKGAWIDSDTPDTEAIFKSNHDHVWLYCATSRWSRVSACSVEGLRLMLCTPLYSLRQINGGLGENETFPWWWMPLETPDLPADAPRKDQLQA